MEMLKLKMRVAALEEAVASLTKKPAYQFPEPEQITMDQLKANIVEETAPVEQTQAE